MKNNETHRTYQDFHELLERKGEEDGRLVISEYDFYKFSEEAKMEIEKNYGIFKRDNVVIIYPHKTERVKLYPFLNGNIEIIYEKFNIDFLSDNNIIWRYNVMTADKKFIQSGENFVDVVSKLETMLDEQTELFKFYSTKGLI